MPQYYSVLLFPIAIWSTITLGSSDHAYAQDASVANLRTKLSDLNEIELHPGINPVELFAAPGKAIDPGVLLFGANANAPFHHPGNILVLFSEFSGSRDSYRTFVVLTDGISPVSNEWTIVPRDLFDDNDHGGDSFTDERANLAGEKNLVKSVRFFNARLDENSVTFIFVAEREFSRGVMDHPGKVHIAAFELQANDERVPAQLRKIADSYTAKSYCHADMALLQELGLGLTKTYVGSQQSDGCTDGKISR
jgi:hypothetical protein